MRCVIPDLSSYDFGLMAVCFNVLKEMYVQEAAIVQEENTCPSKCNTRLAGCATVNLNVFYFHVGQRICVCAP